MQGSPLKPREAPELLPAAESMSDRGVRIDVGRELGHVLRETADQLQALQRTQSEMASVLADRRHEERALETWKALSYALKEANDTQSALATELRRSRRFGLTWLLLALLASGLVLALLQTITGMKEVDVAMREGRDEISRTAIGLREDFDKRSRELSREIDELSALRETMAGQDRAALEQRIAELREEYDQQLFATESRLGDALREKETLGTSQRAMTESMSQVGREMETLRLDNKELRQDLEKTRGLLAAAETQLDARPLPTTELRPSELSFTEPDASANPQAPPPPASAAISENDGVVAAPPDDAIARLNMLINIGADGLGLSVVNARTGDAPGAFTDVMIEKIDDGRPSRRYGSQRMQLHYDSLRKKGIIRLHDGILTMFGWRGSEPFSRDIEFTEFDLQLELRDPQLWGDAGALELRRGGSTPRK